MHEIALISSNYEYTGLGNSTLFHRHLDKRVADTDPQFEVHDQDPMQYLNRKNVLIRKFSYQKERVEKPYSGA